jgi:TRAP-type C4-dicarboxylate transport system permease small subunit
VVVLVCLVLLTLLAVVQVAHFHSNQADADHCPLCLVMQSAVPVAVMTAAIVLVQIGISAPRVEPRPVMVRPHLALFIRPPPAGC